MGEEPDHFLICTEVSTHGGLTLRATRRCASVYGMDIFFYPKKETLARRLKAPEFVCLCVCVCVCVCASIVCHCVIVYVCTCTYIDAHDKMLTQVYATVLCTHLVYGVYSFVPAVFIPCDMLRRGVWSKLWRSSLPVKLSMRN